jgi:hypothetical protein
MHSILWYLMQVSIVCAAVAAMFIAATRAVDRLFPIPEFRPRASGSKMAQPLPPLTEGGLRELLAQLDIHVSDDDVAELSNQEFRACGEWVVKELRDGRYLPSVPPFCLRERGRI